LQKEIQNKTMKKKIPKINVEYIKNNGELYLYLYPLGIKLKKAYQEAFNFHVAHVHSCASMCTHM